MRRAALPPLFTAAASAAPTVSDLRVEYLTADNGTLNAGEDEDEITNEWTGKIQRTVNVGGEYEEASVRVIKPEKFAPSCDTCKKHKGKCECEGSPARAPTACEGCGEPKKQCECFRVHRSPWP